MNSGKYKTIAAPAEGIFKSKGSKFIGFGYPVMDEVEVKRILDNLKKKYHDARHLCYAYILGYDKEISRSNDDNEPSGTAGKPILGQLSSFGLTNTAIMVIRYFGGTLLGTSGLRIAYKNATRDVLLNAQIITKELHNYLELIFQYEQLNQVMRFLKEESMEVVNYQYDTDCSVIIKTPVAQSNKIIEKVGILEKVNYKELYIK